jgi:hypothetical protein
MTATTDNLTLENFTAQTGFRFRISKDQKQRIDGGVLTREEAFQEFIQNGGLKNLQDRTRPDIPDSVYLEPGLTLENFSDRVEGAIGVRRRFRVSQSQHNRMKSGDITRAQALIEVIEAKQSTPSTEDTNE